MIYVLCYLSKARQVLNSKTLGASDKGLYTIYFDGLLLSVQSGQGDMLLLFGN